MSIESAIRDLGETVSALIVEVRAVKTWIEANDATLREVREALKANTGALVEARPKGPVEQGVTTLRRIDRRTLATIVVLVCTLGLGAPAFLWLTGQALHDSPELLGLALSWHNGAGGGTTPTSPEAP